MSPVLLSHPKQLPDLAEKEPRQKDPEVNRLAWAFLPSLSGLWHLRAVLLLLHSDFATVREFPNSSFCSAAHTAISPAPSTISESKHIYSYVILSVVWWAQLLLAINSAISPQLACGPQQLCYQQSQLSDGRRILMLSCEAGPLGPFWKLQGSFIFVAAHLIFCIQYVYCLARKTAFGLCVWSFSITLLCSGWFKFS